MTKQTRIATLTTVPASGSGRVRMRRVITGLAVTTAIALSVARPAVADPGHVVRWNSTGPFAQADWVIDDDFVDDLTTEFLYINIGGTHTISFLTISQATVHWIVTGCSDDVCYYESASTTITTLSVTSGFSFAFDQPLAGAGVRASGLPATRCTTDNNGQRIDECTSVTVDVDVTWTGQGAITRDTQTEQFNVHGVDVYNSWAAASSRNATATGTFAGSALPASREANLAKSSEGWICIGCY